MKEMFSVRKATMNDSVVIAGLIKKEFPYFSVSETEVAERLSRKNITVFKASAKKNMAGFIELELTGENNARINGLTVKEEFRGKDAAKTLLNRAISFLKEKGAEKVTLLVKQSNEKAKSLYKQFGFEYIGLYEKKLGGDVVEEMELSLSEENPSYAA